MFHPGSKWKLSEQLCNNWEWRPWLLFLLSVFSAASISWSYQQTFSKCRFIHRVKVLFWTTSLSTATQNEKKKVSAIRNLKPGPQHSSESLKKQVSMNHLLPKAYHHSKETVWETVGINIHTHTFKHSLTLLSIHLSHFDRNISVINDNFLTRCTQAAAISILEFGSFDGNYVKSPNCMYLWEW